MQKFKDLSQQELLDKTLRLVQEERRITSALLRSLREIDRRRLHLEMGFGSLFEMLVKHYGYSEGAASRRISAMRLSKEAPEIQSSIEAGKLTLSTASQVQHFLQNEKKRGQIYSVAQKVELTQRLEGKSRRQCEQELCQLSPESALPKEKLRTISATQSEIRFIASQRLIDKLEKLQSLLSHHGPLSYAELIEKLADQALKKRDPERDPQRSASPLAAPLQRSMETDTSISHTHRTQKNLIPLHRSHRTHIPISRRRPIWQRANGQCEFVSAHDKRRCTSKWALQIDHIVPLGKWPAGHFGANELSNLRLLCRRHNQWHAVQSYGEKKMAPYILRPIKPSENSPLPKDSQHEEPLQLPYSAASQGNMLRNASQVSYSAKNEKPSIDYFGVGTPVR